jgi:hypothetical protein
MPRHGELTVLVGTAPRLSRLCQQCAGLVEARDHHADGVVMAPILP